MRLMLWGIALMVAAAVIPPDLPKPFAVWVFIAGWFVGMSMFIIGSGRSVGLPGFKRWNA